MAQPATNAVYFDIVINGSPFNSPIERYGSNMQIVCDRCQKSPITQGYGYDTNDMCMPCVNKIKQDFQISDADQVRIKRDMNRTMMQQEQFTTKMAQNQFTPSNNLTFMRQDIFRTSVNFDTIQSFNSGSGNYASLDSPFTAIPATQSVPHLNNANSSNSANLTELIENRGGNNWSGVTRMVQNIYNRRS